MYNWTGIPVPGLEETPKLEETPTADYEEPVAPPLTGNLTSCYICGKSFQGMNPDAVIRRDYSYEVKVPSAHPCGYSVITHQFFVACCWWCDHQHLHGK